MHDDSGGRQPPVPGLGLLHDLAACLRFFSRLPVPALPGEPSAHALPDFRKVARMLPMAGLVLALPAALVLLAAWKLGLGAFVAAALALAMLAAVTGALHEDGLADVADGFGGGGTRERRLEIMRDSRIGAYGGLALVLALALRLGALATMLERIGDETALAFLLAAALSRCAAMLPMVLLAPARRDGAAASVGRPSGISLAIAAGSCLILAGIAAGLGLPAAGVLLAVLLAPTAALALTALAQRRIGGHTGDVIGACQQVAEIAALIGILAATVPRAIV